MSTSHDPVERHYACGGLLSAIVEALRATGKDPSRLTLADLAPVDEFHVRGREATAELAACAGLTPGLTVLDVGCGLGGSARYLAEKYGCRVTGVDLTQEYIETAQALAAMVGLAGQAEFRQANALELPFPDETFDVAWTEHAQMNIPDKEGFFRELARVVTPGGRVAFHDVFSGPGGEPRFPVPWAEAPDISHLAAADEVRALLERMGLRVRMWEDTTARTADWFEVLLERFRTKGRPPLGLHLLMGPSAPAKFENLLHNLREERVTVIVAVVERPER